MPHTTGPGTWSAPDEPTLARLLDRVTWGCTAQGTQALGGLGISAYLAAQLRPGANAALPREAQAQIDAMAISRTPIEALAADMEARNRAAKALPTEDERKAALKAWQQDMRALQQEAAARFVLRALYSPSQLREKMTWFWMNHFNVFAGKGNLRALVGDYEERAVRPHALGRFRDLLGATVRHPAMLRYLDNAQNAAGRINENYARELMELHTLGVDGGYSQQDVQELARVLTGVGVSQRPPGDEPPRMRPALLRHYVREGLFEFNPQRHDWDPKTLLGQPLRAQGLAEVDEALDRLARAPATARFITRKIALFLVGDNPPPHCCRHWPAALSARTATLRQCWKRCSTHQSSVRPWASVFGTRCTTHWRACAWPTAMPCCPAPTLRWRGCNGWPSLCMAVSRPMATRWTPRHGQARGR